jgi:CRP-like cAMP-binding protein
VVSGLLLPVLVLPSWPTLRTLDWIAVPTERIDLLRANPIFRPLPEATIESLARALGEVTAGPGDVVIRQGDPGDRFYLIESGAVEVLVDGEFVGELGAGESFGEIALLRDVPRTATVQAKEDLRLLALERDDFVPAVAGYAPTAVLSR